MTAAPWMRMPSERLASAFRNGDAARDQHRIRPAAHMLYEHLVRFAGERDWCWPGEERLAAQMDCSISTIKRLLRELVGAGLIARARRLNRSSLTYITAYQHEQPYASDIDITISVHSKDETHELVAAAVDDCGGMDTGLDHTNETSKLFFGTTDEPSVGPETNQVIDMKNHHPEGLVDGGDTLFNDAAMAAQSATASVTVQALRNAGVVDPGVLVELAHQPLPQVERAIRSVERIRRADDPRRPGLLVHILRYTRHNDSDRYREQEDDGLQSSQMSKPTDVQVAATPSSEGCRTEMTIAWQNVLAQIAQDVPAEEFRTWLQPTSLVEVDEDVAVVATPNVFVRDVVTERYAPLISQALTTEIGYLVELAVVIG